MVVAYKYTNRRQAADVVETLLGMDGVEVDVYVVPGWVWVRAQTTRGNVGQVRVVMRRHRGVDVDPRELPRLDTCTEIYHTREGAKMFRGYGFIKRAKPEEWAKGFKAKGFKED